MAVYLTYVRYAYGENYSIYNFDTNEERAMMSWEAKDLPNFLSSGPDELSLLTLVECDLTDSEIQLIKDCMNSGKDYDEDFYNLMNDDIHENNSEEIYGVYGDEIDAVVDFACRRCSMPPLQKYFQNYNLNFDDEDELREQIQEILFTDNQLWDTVLRKFIDTNY